MKKIFLFATMFAVSLSMLAQEYMHVWQDGKKTDYVVTEVDSVTFNKMMHNGHEYVDLGLPSGTLWATCNVGANKPEEYGDYFAWGETRNKTTYDWSTYKWFSVYYDNLTKYCTNSSYGSVDNKTYLDMSDDAARSNWGGNWCMPTDEDLIELREQCTWTWINQNGVNGYKLTNKKNSSSIFLPAAGFRGDGSNNRPSGFYGYYWSRSNTDYSYFAYYLLFASSGVELNDERRCCGFSIRPVCTQNSMSQREMYVWQNGGKTTFVVADVDSVTFTKDEEITPPTTGTENGYEWVDLGLSVKWATCNVGATEPEEYGDYFAWGETQPKSTYDWGTYKYCNGSLTSLTKYCTDSYYGTVDNKTTLELSDDAARANWGGSWRMPTDAELTELREQCTWTWTTQNGVYGYKVTSKKSGYTNKSIFLPEAGCRYEWSLGSAVGGYYWSSSLYTDYPSNAWDVAFDSDYVYWDDNSRYYGFSVRPVCQ